MEKRVISISVNLFYFIFCFSKSLIRIWMYMITSMFLFSTCIRAKPTGHSLDYIQSVSLVNILMVTICFLIITVWYISKSDDQFQLFSLNVQQECHKCAYIGPEIPQFSLMSYTIKLQQHMCNSITGLKITFSRGWCQIKIYLIPGFLIYTMITKLGDIARECEEKHTMNNKKNNLQRTKSCLVDAVPFVFWWFLKMPLSMTWEIAHCKCLVEWEFGGEHGGEPHSSWNHSPRLLMLL